nr:ABC transporter permease [Dehalococcoides mccartyi]
MRSMILKRGWLALITVFGVTLFTFLMVHLTPGDPAQVIALARYGLGDATPDEIAWVRTNEGLDSPVYIQYAKWMGHLLQGDLGNSLITGRPVIDELLLRLPATLELAVASMAIALLIAIPLGIISAIRQNTIIDYMGMSISLLGISIPSFWLALLLIMFFAVHLNWFPVFGKGGIEHLVLPAFTIGAGIAALTARLTRSSMLEVLGQNYIRTARSKGISTLVIIGHHALKNALIPVVTVIGLQFAFLLEGTVIVETIFAWPGIGRLLVDSIFNRDFAMIQGCTLFIAIFFVIINLLVDISYSYLDPRIRYSPKRNLR